MRKINNWNMLQFEFNCKKSQIKKKEQKMKVKNE